MINRRKLLMGAIALTVAPKRLAAMHPAHGAPYAGPIFAGPLMALDAVDIGGMFYLRMVNGVTELFYFSPNGEIQLSLAGQSFVVGEPIARGDCVYGWTRAVDND